MKSDYLIVDARGLPCPKPLILTKKQLNNSQCPFIVLVDDKTAKNNISRFLKDNKIKFKLHEENNYFKINVNTDSSTSLQLPKKNNLQKNNDEHSNTVICIKSLEMGNGSEELGNILLRAFITTIKELNPLPTAIIFYNSAVKLTDKNSSILKELKLLEENEVKLLVCGTCTNYFDLTDNIKVGTISNMYEIMEVLSFADTIIYP